jgi:acyl-CoA synthetase (AMP-forming)/AMP-acid ligase II
VAALARAFPGATLARAYDTGEALRVAGESLASGDGWIEVGPTTMLGYLDDAEATRAALVERDGRRLVHAQPPERIAPEALERLIASTPGVREAAVLAIRDTAGERLHAFVAGDASLVPRHPARVAVLESLPHAADGAVDRQALRRMASVD